MKLFLDDERFPPDDGAEWTIVRDMDEAILFMEEHGCPSFISFDHDLGHQKNTGADLAHWMVERDLDDNSAFIPVDFNFYVHSQNPIGVKNIEGLLKPYLAQR